MIASLTHSFVFIRTRKTASTSTEVILGSWCRPGDIVTPIGIESEMLRVEMGGEPRNFSTDRDLEWEFRQALRDRDQERARALYRPGIMGALRFHHHMSAVEARSLLGDGMWEQAFTFAVDRHPYEKALSMAYWRATRREFQDYTWDAWLDLVIERGEYRNWDIYAHDGVPVVSEVIRIDQIFDRLHDLAQQWGVSMPQSIPREKSSSRVDRRPAREILTDAQKSRVMEICQEEQAWFTWPQD